MCGALFCARRFRGRWRSACGHRLARHRRPRGQPLGRRRMAYGRRRDFDPRRTSRRPERPQGPQGPAPHNPLRPPLLLRLERPPEGADASRQGPEGHRLEPRRKHGELGHGAQLRGRQHKLLLVQHPSQAARMGTVRICNTRKSARQGPQDWQERPDADQVPDQARIDLAEQLGRP